MPSFLTKIGTFSDGPKGIEVAEEHFYEKKKLNCFVGKKPLFTTNQWAC